MDDRIVDFNELKNKIRDKDIDKFEAYIYDLYYSVAMGSISMTEFTKKVTEYMNQNNISQEKFFNLQREMLKRYGVDFGEIENQIKSMGIEMPHMNLETDYEKLRKNLSFQEKYKGKISAKNITVYYIKNSLNDIEIMLENNSVIIKSTEKVNLSDVELNEFLCSYKKTLDDSKLNVSIYENVNTYEY